MIETISAIPKSTTQIIELIGCDKLLLVNGSGYWYFMYDDPENNIYETQSVYVMRLKHLALDKWVSIGDKFVSEQLRGN